MIKMDLPMDVVVDGWVTESNASSYKGDKDAHETSNNTRHTGTRQQKTRNKQNMRCHETNEQAKNKNNGICGFSSRSIGVYPSLRLRALVLLVCVHHLDVAFGLSSLVALKVVACCFGPMAVEPQRRRQAVRDERDEKMRNVRARVEADCLRSTTKTSEPQNRDSVPGGAH